MRATHRTVVENSVPADESGYSKCFLTGLIRDRTVTIGGGHPISRNMMDIAKRPLSRPHLQGWSIPPISYRSRSRADRSHTRRLPLPRRCRAWKFSRHSKPKSKCTGCPNKAYVHIVTPDSGWYRRFRHRISGSFAWQGSPPAQGCPDSLCIPLGRSIERAGSGCDRAAMEDGAVNRAKLTEVFHGEGGFQYRSGGGTRTLVVPRGCPDGPRRGWMERSRRGGHLEFSLCTRVSTR
jgi:hypothetical protein